MTGTTEEWHAWHRLVFLPPSLASSIPTSQSEGSSAVQMWLNPSPCSKLFSIDLKMLSKLFAMAYKGHHVLASSWISHYVYLPALLNFRIFLDAQFSLAFGSSCMCFSLSVTLPSSPPPSSPTWLTPNQPFYQLQCNLLQETFLRPHTSLSLPWHKLYQFI